MTTLTGSPATIGEAWGRDVSTENVGGSSSRVYTARRHRVAEMLVDARRWGDRVHAVQDGRRLTFVEHETAIARVAALLASRGVRPGDQVMVMGRNSLECTLAFWACHAVGAVVVLANAWWSRVEVLAAAATFDPVLVLHDQEVAELLPDDLPRLAFDEIERLTEDLGEATTVVLPTVPEDAPALVIFTSGSTGAPKGVLLSQRSVIANLQNLLLGTKRLPSELGEDYDAGVNLLTVPLFHLSGVQVILGGLLTGATLVYQSGRFDPGEVLRLIEAERVTTWGAVPAMVTRAMEHPAFDSRDLSSLRSIPLGGSSASPGFRERVREKFPDLRGGGTGSLYGMTEAGGLVAMGSAKDLAEHPGSVGRVLPIIDVRIDTADGSGAGEILVRSPGLMTGFINGDPPPLNDQGWLRTGDVGHLEPDGFLYLTGRIKDIIIRGGENISCAHVESALISHEAVAEVLVVGLPHPDLQEQVGAVVCLRPGAQVTISELRAHALERLGRFQVPSRWWLRTDLLEANAQGKIVRSSVRDEWLTLGGEDLQPTRAEEEKA
ncbi:class I adenylate-forming enzyme family protein [Rhodococcus opacus]|nr:class I adenylate-forming enzyme family protein [Rhodococcus opacus]